MGRSPDLNVPGTAAAELVQGEVVRDPLNGGASRYILHNGLRISVVDPHPVGSSSFGRIRIYLNPSEKAKLYPFPENFNIQSKILKSMTSITLTRNITQCKLQVLCIKI
jgi:hypothetical protein